MVNELEIEAVIRQRDTGFQGESHGGGGSVPDRRRHRQARLFPPAHPPANSRQWNFGTAGNDTTDWELRSAVEHVNAVLSEAVLFESALEQRHIDRLLLEADGTENKGKLGANAILGRVHGCGQGGCQWASGCLFTGIWEESMHPLSPFP